MLDLTIIKAITLDLDDTLWPIWPAIERAEKALEHWLSRQAPMTAALFANQSARHEIRAQVLRSRPELKHDLSAIRREAIRVALYRSGEDPLLAEAGFDVFYAERNRVTLFDDALQSLAFLASRFPLIALSNGSADIRRIGIESYFRASISAPQFGVAKPDPRIFLAAASAAEVLPSEVLHVGDDAMLDVLGALNCGMQTVWVNRSEHLWAHPDEPHETVSTLVELCELFPA
ncbi:putative hydrolase of the HAD superfamily [Polaromonas sp. OV174]|uniref:HAD family hydrolase n=1 Tax=Polaromonas sp. OV174 TaxID=1855300 RepID=UPI0008F3B3AE|nr:HAD family hydrolase [Polaromonas sp. OV174]SFC43410.1 putative hydrolase of the HAD superfamily [Polaromonas sp. OV174]